MRKYHAEITSTKTGFLARILSESGSQWGHAVAATIEEVKAAASHVITALVKADRAAQCDTPS